MKDNNEDTQTDCCWALSSLSEGSYENIHTVLVANEHLVPKLVELMQHTNVNLQLPSIKTIGNIALGDENQRQCVIHFGALPVIYQLLSHHDIAIRKEAARTTSNVAAGNFEQIQEFFNSWIWTFFRYSTVWLTKMCRRYARRLRLPSKTPHLLKTLILLNAW